MNYLPGPAHVLYARRASPESRRVLLFRIRAAVLLMNARKSRRAQSASTVPAYLSNGRRVRNYSREAVDAMLAVERPSIVAKYNRRTGRVTSITFIPGNRNSRELEKEPLRKSVHMGQAYSFRESVSDSGRKAWSHSNLLSPRDADAEAHLISVFRAVPLSCMATIIEMPKREVVATDPLPPTAPAKVIVFKPRVAAPTSTPYSLPIAA
jgi:hypothetical protein